MKRDATETVVRFTRAGLKDLLNPMEGNNGVEEITREDLVRKPAGFPDESDDGVRTEDVFEDGFEEVCSLCKQLKYLALDKATFERHGTLKTA